MIYHFVYDQSQEDVPTLVVYRTQEYFLGGEPQMINVFTGDRATALYKELTER